MAQKRQRGRLIAAIRLALYPAFEPSDQRWLQSLTLDANTARRVGNYSQAEVLYLTAIREAERRPELASHLHCARGGLALVYQAQARYAEVESIYLDQLTEAKDSSQPDTRLHAAYMSLAGLYQDEGRYAEAEEQRSEERRVGKE